MDSTSPAVEKPVIIYANDDRNLLRAAKRNLEFHYPQAEIVACETIKDCHDALKQYENRITMLITDDGLGWSGGRAGSNLARKIRHGDFGQTLRTIPIVIVSGDPYVQEMKPPVVYVHIFKREELHSYIDRYAFGGEDWNLAVSAFTKQESRDHAARQLIGCFPPYPFTEALTEDERKTLEDLHNDLNEQLNHKRITSQEYFSRIDLFHDVRQSTRQNQAIQTSSFQEIQAFTKERYDYMCHLAHAAFDGGHPTQKEGTDPYKIGLLKELIDAVGRDKFYVADDGYANRYNQLKSEIRLAALNALKKADPIGAEFYEGKQR